MVFSPSRNTPVNSGQNAKVPCTINLLFFDITVIFDLNSCIGSINADQPNAQTANTS